MSKLNTAGKEVPLSNDPDKADKSGFLHGIRATMKKVRAILYNYPNKDGVGATNDDGSEVQAPGVSVHFETKDGQSYQQFYANGSADQRVPNKKGTGFILAPGSSAKSGLVEGGNAYLLMASLKGCGWPTDKLNDFSLFDGTVVDLIAQPVGQSKRAKEEGKPPRTIAVVGKIVKYPEGVTEDSDEDEPDTDDEDDEDETPAPKKKAKPAPVEDDDDDDDEDEAPAPKSKAKSKPAPVEDEDEDAEEEEDADDDDDAADPLVTEAQEYVSQVLLSKPFAGKSIDLPTLSTAVLKLCKTNKNRQKIIALVQDPAFHKTEGVVWVYDKKTKSISIEE